MTDTTTQKLITQLRTLHHLTNTEAQIAQTRQAQARDEAVREELATNAANAHERAQLIAAALGDEPKLTGHEGPARPRIGVQPGGASAPPKYPGRRLWRSWSWLITFD